jgi:hypothetical protein
MQEHTVPVSRLFRRINSSFGIKIGIALLVLTVFSTGSAVFFIYVQTHNMVLELMGDRLKDIGRTGTYLFNEEDRESIKRLKALAAKDMGNVNSLTAGIEEGETVESLPADRSKEIMKGKDFQRLVQNLRQIKAASRRRLDPLRYLPQVQPEEVDLPLVTYCYIFTEIPEVPDKSVLMFLADADFEPRGEESGSPIGNLFVTSGQESYRKAFEGIPSAETEFTRDQWGTWLTSMIPVF